MNKKLLSWAKSKAVGVHKQFNALAVFLAEGYNGDRLKASKKRSSKMNEEDKSAPIDWCPQMIGSTTAYLPEHFNDGKWKKIPFATGGINGVPSPKHMGALFQEAGLYGYEQAMALAWWHAAEHKAERHNPVAVRVQEYRFEYEIKASKTDMPVIKLYGKEVNHD